jgi:5'-methylthioadenosine phosphorylase
MSDVKIGLIGGSGLGQALAAQTEGVRHDVETPFGRPSDAIVETTWANVPVLVLNRHGPGHLLNPSHVPYRANIFALKSLGCTHIIASGAVGSLREEFKPRHLVIADQVIDKTFKRASTFYERASVHVEFAEPFCPVLRQILIEAGAGLAASGEGQAASEANPALAPGPSPLAPGFVVHGRGCYVAMEGPAFSTRAESLMHRLWGGDLIGMTAVPEARLAREAEIAYALVALVTDYDCWKGHDDGQAPQKPDPFALLKEIIGNLEATTKNAIELMRKAVELIAHKPAGQLESPSHHALRLGIWSDKTKIDPDEVKRLGPLWMKYFGTTDEHR